MESLAAINAVISTPVVTPNDHSAELKPLNAALNRMKLSLAASRLRTARREACYKHARTAAGNSLRLAKFGDRCVWLDFQDLAVNNKTRQTFHPSRFRLCSESTLLIQVDNSKQMPVVIKHPGHGLHHRETYLAAVVVQRRFAPHCILQTLARDHPSAQLWMPSTGTVTAVLRPFLPKVQRILTGGTPCLWTLKISHMLPIYMDSD